MKKITHLLSVLIISTNVIAQTFESDPTFNIGSGSNSIYTMDAAVQSDGKLVVIGAFTTYNGTSRVGIVRINTDGSIDNTFNPGTGFNGCCNQYDLLIQSDGKILVSGYFSDYQGNSRNGIVRLNSDGSLDAGFNIGSGFGGSTNAVNDIVLQPDGKIIAVGNFGSYNGNTRNQIIRLNTDGSIDNTFSIGTGLAGGAGTAVALQSDGKVLVGGTFTSYNGTSVTSMVRLNTDGSIDNTFSTGNSVSVTINKIVVQPDGKILITACGFTGISNCGIGRLNSNGSVDATFNGGGTGTNTGNVATINLQSDGKILMSGYFTEYNGVPVNFIIRLNSDASLDNTFLLTGTGFNHYSWEVLHQSSGKIYAVGHFSTFNGVSQNYVIRLSEPVPPVNMWTGDVNTDWNNTGNWDDGVIPTGTTNTLIPTTPSGGVFPIVNITTAIADDIEIETGASVTIPSGNALTINGVLTNDGTVTIQSGGSLVQATGSTLAGSGTYNINRTGTSSTTKFNFWSSPITSGTLPGSNGYRYNSASGTHSNTDDNPGPDPGWVAFSGTMSVGRGYASVGGGTATFSGTVNNGTINNVSVTTSAQIPTSTTAPSYFNLIGNPYPSSVNVAAFLADNALIDGTVWFWDDDNSGGTGYTTGDYATRTSLGGTAGGGGNTPNGSIGSGQGFFVKANSNGNVSFENDQRGTSNTQFLKTEEETNLIWLNMKNDTLYNEILIGFVSDATEGYDNYYDGYKFRGNPYIAFAAKQQGDEFAIAAFPTVESERIIPLTTHVANEGIYTISNLANENMSGITVYLEDRFLNSFTNLANNGSYSTLINTANSVDRFYLHFAPAIVTGVEENNDVTVIAYITAGELTVMFGNMQETQGTFNIIDMTGKTVYSQADVNLIGNVYRTDVSSLASGIYAINFVTDNAVYNKKVLVK